MKKLYFIGVIVLILFLVVIIGLRISNKSDKKAEPVTQALNLELQTNNEGTVIVSVAPKNLSGPTWDFEIVLNTHSEELDADLVEVSTLIDENGKEYKPVSWEGSPAGGHHREGILRFEPISPRPKSIILKIRQVGGFEERSFAWQLK